MAVSTTDNRVEYVGNGVTTAFPIDFQFSKNADIKALLVDNTTDVETALTLITDFTLIGEGVESGGTLTMLVAPTADETLVIYRDPDLLQDLEIELSGKLPSQEIERSFDKIVMMVQRVKDIASRALKLPEGFSAAFDMRLPAAIKDNPGATLVVNETGDGFELGPTADEISDGGGVPPGGDEGAVLTKLTASDGETEWKQFAFSGFSARFGAIFESINLQDTLEKILNLQYSAPLITLSASGGSTIREKGDAVTSTTLTAAITKRSDPINEVRFYQNPSTLLDTQNSGGAIPNGGNSTYNWTGSFSDTTTFRAEVDDDGSTGGPTTVSATATFTFVYPYYVGAGAAALPAASVAGLTKRIITSTANRTETIAASNGNVFYFAYPASYGALTSILDVNNFETINDWTQRTENITGLDGNAVSYYIYEFENPVVAGNYQYTFKR